MHRTLAAIAVLIVVPLLLQGQSASSLKSAGLKSSAVKSSKPYKAPRTPWGDPDLQGSWPAQFNIPMSRPANLKDKEILSDEEFEQQKTQRAKQSAGVNA